MQHANFQCSAGKKGSFVSIWKHTFTLCDLRASKRLGVSQSFEVDLPSLPPTLNSPNKNEGDFWSYLPFPHKKPTQPNPKSHTIKTSVSIRLDTKKIIFLK